MNIQYLFLVSRQGKIRLVKWYVPLSLKEKQKVLKDLSTLVTSRRSRMCNVLEFRDDKVIYKRYASLYFVVGVPKEENELLILELIHRFVETLDKYFGNVCELDLIFNFHKAYYLLDELIVAGEMDESSRKAVLKYVGHQDAVETEELEATKTGTRLL